MYVQYTTACAGFAVIETIPIVRKAKNAITVFILVSRTLRNQIIRSEIPDLANMVPDPAPKLPPLVPTERHDFVAVTAKRLPAHSNPRSLSARPAVRSSTGASRITQHNCSHTGDDGRSCASGSVNASDVRGASNIRHSAREICM
jgi:hypothetical protein